MDPVNSDSEILNQEISDIEKSTHDALLDDPNVIENHEENEQDMIEDEQPKKRGRGRPPKGKAGNNSNAVVQVIHQVSSPPQAGRPKRQVTPKVDSNYVYNNNAGPSNVSPAKPEKPSKLVKAGVKRKLKTELDEEIVYEMHEISPTEEIGEENNEIVQVNIVQENIEEAHEGEEEAHEAVEEIHEIEGEEADDGEQANEEDDKSNDKGSFPDGYLPTDDKRVPKKVYMKDPQDPMRRFQCPYAGCSYVAKYRSNLWDHKKTHTGEKPYQCTWPDCNMRFSQTHQLKLHTRSHTGERPYRCTWPGCDAAFSQKPGLRSHKLTHTGEKSFVCDFPGCNWSFRLKGALTDHKRAIHEDKKMHVCEWPGCGKRFLQNCHLKKHLMAHADIKPYACDWPKCSYKAVTMAYVTNHRRTHTGERNHECNFPGCHKKFVKSSHVNRHRQRCHPNMFRITGEGEFIEQEYIEDEEADYPMEQEVQNDIQNEDNENLAENDQIVIEYSEQENEIIIQSGNSQKIFKGQLVEDKEGRQYIISGDEMISLQDIISEEQITDATPQEA